MHASSAIFDGVCSPVCCALDHPYMIASLAIASCIVVAASTTLSSLRRCGSRCWAEKAAAVAVVVMTVTIKKAGITARTKAVAVQVGREEEAAAASA